MAIHSIELARNPFDKIIRCHTQKMCDVIANYGFDYWIFHPNFHLLISIHKSQDLLLYNIESIIIIMFYRLLMMLNIVYMRWINSLRIQSIWWIIIYWTAYSMLNESYCLAEGQICTREHWKNCVKFCISDQNNISAFAGKSLRKCCITAVQWWFAEWHRFWINESAWFYLIISAIHMNSFWILIEIEKLSATVHPNINR